MKLRVLYFAIAKDLAGVSEEILNLAEASTIADARRAIAALHPTLASTDSRLRVARNETFAEADEILSDGDVLAIIPPVAGG